MIDNLIHFSIHNKFVILLFTICLVVWGGYSLSRLPLDAIPDITNNQVQVMTYAPSLAPQEVEQFITFPIEMALANIQGRVELRSISRIGLSIVTIVFDEDMDILKARQLVGEQIKIAESKIPAELGRPEMMPITSGLGEIYQYVLVPQKGYEKKWSPMELRTIQDWIVKRYMAGIRGVADLSSFGGFVKQYEVGINTDRLRSFDLTIQDVFIALSQNNQNTGGSYIEKNQNAYYIRAEGLAHQLSDIEQIVVKNINNVPILVKDVAEVKLGFPPRFGAMTKDGTGETVGGVVMMLKGANSSEVINNVHQRVVEVQKVLPKGLRIEPYLDRSILVHKTIKTVAINLAEGGLIVIFILVLLMGNLRAGLVVASVIPLALLFAFGMMNIFGVSANLMSLGAIDFGLVVDGAIIIVEAVMHHLSLQNRNNPQKLNINDVVYKAAVEIRQSAAFGEIIILMVYLPILALTGIEGKIFKPMAQTVTFAILGALILSLTYVPMMTAWALRKNISPKRTFADKMMDFLYRFYYPILISVLRKKVLVLTVSMLMFLGSLVLFFRMGGEFIPTLDEGDLACQQLVPTGSSLTESINTSSRMQKILLANFPEVKEIVAKTGTAEIPTDPMGVEDSDIMIILKPKNEWTSATTKAELVEKMKAALIVIPNATYEFTQPIQLRFNELMTGVKTDIAVEIFGEDLEILANLGQKASAIISKVEGAGDVRVEQTEGLPQLMVQYKREKVAQYGLNISQLNQTVRAAFAGEVAGDVFEGEKRFELVVRLGEKERKNLNNLQNLYVALPNGNQILLREVADIVLKSGAALISRQDGKRRITVGINARNRDVESLVGDIEQQLNAKIKLPAGYYIDYGGQFENLQAAKARLSVAVPIALAMIFVLLFFTFNSIKQSLMIFSAIPLSAIGGIVALWLRDMPFSISAGVGFITLFGVAVLNGIVLIGHFNHLAKDGMTNTLRRIVEGTKTRFRPVLMTALVAALGFFPMALATDAGAEVQKPLATVVIGGLISATLLTLLVLPILYHIFDKKDLQH